MKTLSYSYVKHSPSVAILLLTVEKIKCEKFYYVFLLTSSFFLVTTNAILPEFFLSLIRAVCELRLTSYCPKQVSRWLSCTPYCAYSYRHNSKTKGRTRMLYLWNYFSTIGEIYSYGWSCMQDMTCELWIQK